MTTASTPRPTNPDDAAPLCVGRPTGWDRFESWLGRFSEKLNPILVKESRQAVKSRQFAVTFTLLLSLGWGWSLLGVAIWSPGIFYAPGGASMLIGYLYVLAFPLIVIVPFAAYRSLAAEREDGTYELLSITALSPRQIVGGKLGSAVVQMLVYLSALSPCLAFTYLLRGIDILTILLLIFYTFLGSLLLSVCGLLIATMPKNRQLQVLFSVLLIVVLMVSFLCVCSWGTMVVVGEIFLPFDHPDFWIAQLTLMTFYVTTVALFYQASAARITPVSENRSTTLRVIMLLQHFLLVGWFVYFGLRSSNLDLLYGLLWLAVIYWYVMGVLMTGESAQLSQRVKRKLPRSFLGRAFFTWFNPGPGTGFIFAVANLLSVILFVLIGMLIAEMTAFTSGLDLEMAWFAVVGWCYLVCFLGVAYLLIQLVRRKTRFPMLGAVVLHFFMFVLAVVAPLILQLSILYEDNYTPLQITNPVWTLVEIMESQDALDFALAGFPGVPLVPIGLILFAGLVLFTCILVMARDIRHVYRPTPARVAADDQLLQGAQSEAVRNGSSREE